MTKVKILIYGYVKGDGSKVEPTTTLIQDGKTNIIVDPGMGKNKPTRFRKALAREGLKLKDINIVFCTHYHLDHTQYIGLFPKARIIDFLYTYEGDKWLDHKGEGYKLSPNVSIIHTPGHTPEHASLKVKANKEIVIIAGDVWWLETMEPKIDEMALDQKQLEKSREKVLEVADWIIPGHGKIFKNPKKI